MFIHLFTVRAEMFTKPTLDSLLTIDASDPLVMMDEPTMFAAQEISHVPEEVISKRNQILSYITSTEIRSRFNADIYKDILRLDAESEMTMEDLEHYVQSFPTEELQSKFMKWKFK